MNYGETISIIRKSKNISVQDTIQGIMSRASFERLSNDQTQTSVSNFVGLLSNLHVSFEEFMYIKNGYSLDPNQILLKDIYKQYLEKNISNLKFLQDSLLKDSSKDITKRHNYCLITLCLNVLNNESYDEKAKKTIESYLINCETWTHYELILFNNAMPIFNTEVLNILIKRAVNNIEKYQNLRAYGSESFRIITNALIIFLDRKETAFSYQLIKDLETFDLTDDMIFEKITFKFFKGIIYLINHNKKGSNLVNDSLKALKYASSNTYYNLYLNLFKKFDELYGFNIGGNDKYEY